MITTMFMMTVILFLNLAIPVCIGVFVYRDAKQRGMEAIIWMLVAVLVPGFIGLIIYLIARTKYSSLRCARCGAAVKEDYAVCPQCGTDLWATCPSCGKLVQPDWNVCAHCGAQLSQQRESYVTEPSSMGKSLWVALGIVVVIAILIVLIFSVSAGGYSFPVTHNMSTVHHFI